MASNIRFPAELPIALRDSYSETYEQIHRATQFETGTVRRRARMRISPIQFGLNFTLSEEEFRVFDNWWQFTVLGGQNLFDIQLMDGDDIDPLLWYTVSVINGQYTLDVTQSYVFEVAFTVRCVNPPFLNRTSGTDELRGTCRMGMQSLLGNALIFTPLRGSASLGLNSISAISNLPPLRGTSMTYFIGRGRLS